MSYTIISDSSSDLLSLPGMAYANVPLKIITDQKEYVDDGSLDVDGMIADLRSYKGTSKSSCPNIDDWSAAFGDHDHIICITITSGLSGSNNTANLALKEHLDTHPEKQGMVIDSLSTGPENALIIEKLQEMITAKFSFEDIKQKIKEYQAKTHLIFSLDSLRNLANNGRVSMAVAKVAGILGIRVVGKASDEGTLEITSKVRGRDKALAEILGNMLKTGYAGGKVRIHHCQNQAAAQTLVDMIKQKFKDAAIKVQETRGLCSFYAESGGLLVGYEG